jgi:hypothetical protein
MDLKKDNHKLKEQVASLKHNMAYLEQKSNLVSTTS